MYFYFLTNILCTFWSSNQKVQVKLLIGIFIVRTDYENISSNYHFTLNSMKQIYLLVILFASLAQYKAKYPKCECGKAKRPKNYIEKQRQTYNLFKNLTLQVNSYLNS